MATTSSFANTWSYSSSDTTLKRAPKNLFSFTPLPAVVQRHLHQVYLQLFFLVLCSTFGAYINLTYSLFNRGFIPLISSLGLLSYFLFVPPHPHNFNKRRGILGAFAFCQGLCLGPLINLAIDVGGPQLVVAALGATTAIFLGLAVSSMMTRRRSWLYLGGTLMGCTTAMFWMSLFLRYEWVFNVLVYGGLVVFCGFVLYDSQKIVESAADGDRDVLKHALVLFDDVVAIFRRVLIIMIKNKMKKKERKRRERD